MPSWLRAHTRPHAADIPRLVSFTSENPLSRTRSDGTAVTRCGFNTGSLWSQTAKQASVLVGRGLRRRLLRLGGILGDL
jgi:hypothetical protein